MRRGLFVTGTNTGVGKTVVTRALARAALRRGLRPVALKPVESGVTGVQETDAACIARAAGRSASTEDYCLYAFSQPVSPHLAARLDNRIVDPARIAQFLTEWTAHADVVIAEGAGGLLVPLADGVTFGDVVARTDYALLIVAPDVLGTINGTLLTIEAARQRQIPICGVVLNGTGVNALENGAAVAKFGQVPVFGTFPALKNYDDDSLADAAEAALDLDRLFAFLTAR
jgi:dethiobiotin synthetase